MPDDSKLRLRKNAHHVAVGGGGGDCEEGGGSSSLKGYHSNDRLDNMASGSSHHNHPHPHTFQSISATASFGTSDPLTAIPNLGSGVEMSGGTTTAPSYGAIKGRRKRRRRRESVKQQCQIFLKGCAATVISITLSVLLLPFSWIQVDYHHQVQHEMQYLVQVVKDTRSNSRTLFRGIASSSSSSPNKRRQVVCNDGYTLAIQNDNYCDCPDGQDEWLTSACSHKLVSHEVFVCHNDNPVHKIYASRVNDGIQDCDDGSDERRSSSSLAVVPEKNR